MTKNKKQGVPGGLPSKKPLEPVTFNLGQMVENYIVAKTVSELLHRNKHLEAEAATLHGVTIGYDDWFDIMKIDQDKFDEIHHKLDRDETTKKIRDLHSKILSQVKKGKRSGLLLPGGVSLQEQRAVREVFKKQLGRKL